MANTGKTPFPIFQIVYIVLAAYLLYWLISWIVWLLSYGCGRHRPALMLERFSSDGASSKKYFKDMSLKVVELNKQLEGVRSVIAEMKERNSGLHEEICYITDQIDESLKGNYVGNVPEEEYSLPADQQAKRKALREQKAETYIKEGKKRFSESYEKTPLIECFDAITEDEKAGIAEVKEQLMNDLNELESNITQTSDEFKIVRGNLSEKQIAVYYASLAYNDKNIKELLKTMQKVNEGFASAEQEEVLDFTPPKIPSTDMNREPHIRIPKLVERLQKLEAEVMIVNKAMRVFSNTAKMQQKTLKQIKLVANNEGEQKRQLDQQASKQAAKQAAKKGADGRPAMPPG
jgi:hypothetical protein